MQAVLHGRFRSPLWSRPEETDKNSLSLRRAFLLAVVIEIAVFAAVGYLASLHRVRMTPKELPPLQVVPVDLPKEAPPPKLEPRLEAPKIEARPEPKIEEKIASRVEPKIEPMVEPPKPVQIKRPVKEPPKPVRHKLEVRRALREERKPESSVEIKREPMAEPLPGPPPEAAPQPPPDAVLERPPEVPPPVESAPARSGPIRHNVVPLSGDKPDYPMRARREGIEGWVKVHVSISEKGDVTNVAIVDANPRHIFDQSVVNALMHYKYEASAAPYVGEMIVNFKLSE